MKRSYIAGCCVIVAAAGLGYWIFSDKLSHRPPPPALAPAQENGEASNEPHVVYGTRPTGDVIDLSLVFDPTGEELDLHNLLHGQPVAELVPFPRDAEPELGPAPREDVRELLHAPQLARREYPDAGEEATPSPAASAFREPFSWITAGLIAEWLSQSLPLKGNALRFDNPHP
jgi:hypothetical protein